MGAELAAACRHRADRFPGGALSHESEVPQQVGNDHPTSMPTSAYKAADGYLNVAASGEGM